MRRLFFTLSFSLPLYLHAAGFASLEAMVDARGAAMGYTGLASGVGPNALVWNPALLSGLRGFQAAWTYTRWIQGVKAGALGASSRGLGFQLRYCEVDGIEHRLLPSEEPLGTFSAVDLLWGIGYGRRLNPRFAAGIACNGYYEKIYIDEAVGMGLDLGILWTPGGPDLRFGAALRHLGLTEKLRRSRIVLPLEGRVGVAKEWDGSFGGFQAVGEVGYSDEGVLLHAGIAWTGPWISFRLGYASPGSRPLTFGIGLGTHGFRLSYAYLPFRHGLGEAHLFTVEMSP